MRTKRYTRLKLRMFLAVTVGAFLAAGGCFLLCRLLSSTPLGVPVAGLYHALARALFGRTAEEADDLIAGLVLPNLDFLFGVLLVIFLLLNFCLAMGRFTRWFDQISRQVHRMAEDVGEEEVVLPKVLFPVEEELNGIRRTLLRREAEAEQSAQRARDLVAFLAHDLKTPMTSVIGYLSLLNDQPDLDAGQRAKYTGIALDKARRLEELISEFFDINRMEMESIGEGEDVSLSMLLEQLSDEFWPLFEEKRLVFRAAIGDGLTVRGDPDKLARVFDNVLRNAVNYSVEGGAVGLRAFRQGAEITISVSNEGLEIPEKELTNIFQKFYRLDAARSTRTGGAGLGLAIAREIVERHGGSIRAESTGKRAVFTITLPARV